VKSLIVDAQLLCPKFWLGILKCKSSEAASFLKSPKKEKKKADKEAPKTEPRSPPKVSNQNPRSLCRKGPHSPTTDTSNQKPRPPKERASLPQKGFNLQILIPEP